MENLKFKILIKTIWMCLLKKKDNKMTKTKMENTKSIIVF